MPGSFRIWKTRSFHSKPAKHISDPYARRREDIKDPPVGLRATLKHLGPGFVLAGAVVGSGEIILTTTLGAKVCASSIKCGRLRRLTTFGLHMDEDAADLLR